MDSLGTALFNTVKKRRIFQKNLLKMMTGAGNRISAIITQHLFNKQKADEYH